MLNLPEVRLRIKNGLEKHKNLKWRKENIQDQIIFIEGELANLRDREAELEVEAFNEGL